jgi:hypothetical protein
MHKPKIDRVLAAKILTGAACIGVVITSYFAIKKGSKVVEKIEETKAELETEEDKSKLEVAARYISRVAPVIAPVVISGGVTEACIVGALVLPLTEIAALTVAVTYLIANRKALEEAICELPGGKEALEKAKEKVAVMSADQKIKEDAANGAKPWKHQSIEETGNGKDLCFDAWSGRLFRCDPRYIKKKLEEFNKERDEGMELPFSDHDENLPISSSYNDVYFTRIGLEPSMLCHMFGYPSSDDYYPHRRIPFEIKVCKYESMDELRKEKYGEDLYVVTFPDEYAPMEGWQEV